MPRLRCGAPGARKRAPRPQTAVLVVQGSAPGDKQRAGGNVPGCKTLGSPLGSSAQCGVQLPVSRPVRTGLQCPHRPAAPALRQLRAKLPCNAPQKKPPQCRPAVLPPRDRRRPQWQAAPSLVQHHRRGAASPCARGLHASLQLTLQRSGGGSPRLSVGQRRSERGARRSWGPGRRQAGKRRSQPRNAPRWRARAAGCPPAAARSGARGPAA
mmetsp:Transcript_2132/g.6454  ORF Transcript_2132/g.6454 Transcript_2132/m.6454 type:complete len:212 (-) Transcript_2132:33-668(-)